MIAYQKLSPVSPLLVAPTLQGGAKDIGIDPEEDVVDVKRDAVFGDPICGKCAITEDELLLQPKQLPCPKEMTRDEFLRHCVTHLPYHHACLYCVAGKKPTTHQC